MLDTEKIAAIRNKLAANGCASMTSTTFQNQLISFIDLNSESGDFVIEVGCFRGGLTAQLAYVTSELGKKLYVIDIDQSMLDCAAQAVKKSTGSIPDSTHFFRGNLVSFLSQPRVSDRCILAFIDGDHFYDGVVKDIRALLSGHLARPLYIAFHDFSLRYNIGQLTNVRVDQAIRDTLKNEILLPIGELSGLSTLISEPPSAQEQEHPYFYKGGSEGALDHAPSQKL